MDSKKEIAISVINFLKSEVESQRLGEDKTESLEVVIQCLEEAYDISSGSSNEFDLLQMFESRFGQKQNPFSLHKPATEEDKIKAEELKVEGNNLMKVEKYSEAIDCYTRSIQHDGNNAVYFCNRAAAYTKQDDSVNAVADCEKALSIDPNYSKAYGRLGLVYLNEKDYNKAVTNYEKAVALEPNNMAYKNNLGLANEKMQTQTGSGATPSASNPLAGMDLSAMLSNPAVINMAQSFMQNPQMQSMFTNMMGGSPPQSQNTPSTTEQDPNLTPQGNTPADGVPSGDAPGGFQLPSGLDVGNIMNATQRFAEQMQQQDPELVDNLRSQFQQDEHPNNGSNGSEEEPK